MERLLAGFIYALSAMFTKIALRGVIGVVRLSFLMNLVFVLAFSLLFLGEREAFAWELGKVVHGDTTQLSKSEIWQRLIGALLMFLSIFLVFSG